MIGCVSTKPSDGIRPTPQGSSPSTSAALVARHTGVWFPSVSTTQIWLPVQPAGVEPGLQAVADLSAQRSPVAVLGSTTHTCVAVQALLQGGLGRSTFSTSAPATLPAPTTTQSAAVSGCVFFATA